MSSKPVYITIYATNACTCFGEDTQSQPITVYRDANAYYGVDGTLYGEIFPGHLLSWIELNQTGANAVKKLRTCDYSENIVRVWGYRFDIDSAQMRATLKAQNRHYMTYDECVKSLEDTEYVTVFVSEFMNRAD